MGRGRADEKWNLFFWLATQYDGRVIFPPAILGFSLSPFSLFFYRQTQDFQKKRNSLANSHFSSQLFGCPSFFENNLICLLPACERFATFWKMNFASVAASQIEKKNEPKVSELAKLPTYLSACQSDCMSVCLSVCRTWYAAYQATFEKEKYQLRSSLFFTY